MAATFVSGKYAWVCVWLGGQVGGRRGRGTSDVMDRGRGLIRREHFGTCAADSHARADAVNGIIPVSDLVCWEANFDY